jgi:cytochrome b-561
MIAAALLHLLRVFFTGLYKNPREINWLVGLLLLFLTVFASFSGYLLPFDAFSVTATGISYHIARSTPWVGPALADFIFAGKFPALGTLPRFYAYHVVIVPSLLISLLLLHLVILLKQKHSQPYSVRALTGSHKVLGTPFWPQQALLMVVLFLMLSGVLLMMAGLFPVHPVAYYGPPEPATPVVKPDWYLLWWYGALRLVPSWVDFELLGTSINPENMGGIFFPLLLLLLLALLPFVDRVRVPVHFMELPSVHRVRTAVGIAALAFFAVLMVTAYDEELGLSIAMLRLMSLLIPALIGVLVYWGCRWYGSRTGAHQEIDKR